MPRIKMPLALALATIAVVGFAPAATAQEPHAVVQADAIQWGPGPEILPKGTQLAVVHGHPDKPGHVVLRIRLPNGAAVPAHWHSKAEYVTVLQGTFHIGMGEAPDKAKTQAVKTGGFFAVPAKMAHYGWIEGDTTVEVHAESPFDFNLVTPSKSQ